MNKEEIEKEDKEHLIEVLTEHKDYIFEFDDDNIKIEYISNLAGRYRLFML